MYYLFLILIASCLANPLPQELNEFNNNVYAECSSSNAEYNLSDENTDSQLVDVVRRSSGACPANPSLSQPAAESSQKSRQSHPSANYCPKEGYEIHVSCGGEVVLSESTPQAPVPQLSPNKFTTVLNCVPGATSVIPAREPWPEQIENPHIAQYCCAIFVDRPPAYAASVCIKATPSVEVQQFTLKQWQDWFFGGKIPWINP